MKTEKVVAPKNEVVFKFEKVGKYFLNTMGGVHGGALATWVDIVTSAGVTMFDAKDRITHVSVALNMDYISGAKGGEDLYFKVVVPKIGKNLAFTFCQIINEKGAIVVNSTHTKAFTTKVPAAKL